MKKSLLLSIVMTLVLVVAMSTATFAWYTAQAEVSVTDTTINAAASDASSLAIDTTATPEGKNTSLTMTLAGEVAPMAPEAAIVKDAAMPVMKTASIDNAGKFNSDPSTATPATIGSVTGSDTKAQSFFYVTNTHDTDATDIAVSVTFNETTNLGNLVVAVLVEVDSNMVVKAIFSENGKYKQKDCKFCCFSFVNGNGVLLSGLKLCS